MTIRFYLARTGKVLSASKADIAAFCSIGQSGLGAAVRCVLHQGPLRAGSVARHKWR
jgi:hypothetical protein